MFPLISLCVAGRDDRGVRAGAALLPRHAAQGQGVPGQGLLPLRKVQRGANKFFNVCISRLPPTH